MKRCDCRKPSNHHSFAAAYEGVITHFVCVCVVCSEEKAKAEEREKKMELEPQLAQAQRLIEEMQTERSRLMSRFDALTQRLKLSQLGMERALETSKTEESELQNVRHLQEKTKEIEKAMEAVKEEYAQVCSALHFFAY